MGNDDEDDDDDDDDDDDGNSLPLIPILCHIKPVRSPHLYFWEIRFITIIIICQSTPEASKWSLPLRFPAIPLYTPILFTIRPTCPNSLNLLYLIIRSNILCSYVLALYFSFFRHSFLIFKSQFLSLTLLLLLFCCC